MEITPAVKSILNWYSTERIPVKSNLARMLMQGSLGGTGKLVILPVDQGFEHGPDRAFSMNPQAYDPKYHLALATSGQVSAYAAPLGMLSMVAEDAIGKMPLILKLNSGNTFMAKEQIADQGITASVKDAVELGCVGVGFTLYPGSLKTYDMMEEAREIIAEAKAQGLFTVIWSYPRGPSLKGNEGEALDVVAYGSHMAALLGAHVIKVKIPGAQIAFSEHKKLYDNTHITNMTDRVRSIMQSSFAGQRLVVFSGGAKKEKEEVFEEIKAIAQGGGSGSIIGRNLFQRPREEALAFLQEVFTIYKNKTEEMG